MGRDKPIRVEGTPRGLGLYRRQGREGFFFIKNWSHIAKDFPGALERNGQFDEWIKRPDGSLVDNLKEAKAYCLRRAGELDHRTKPLPAAESRPWLPAFHPAAPRRKPAVLHRRWPHGPSRNPHHGKSPGVGHP